MSWNTYFIFFSKTKSGKKRGKKNDNFSHLEKKFAYIKRYVAAPFFVSKNGVFIITCLFRKQKMWNEKHKSKSKKKTKTREIFEKNKNRKHQNEKGLMKNNFEI